MWKLEFPIKGKHPVTMGALGTEETRPSALSTSKVLLRSVQHITDKISIFQSVYSCSLFGENNSSMCLFFTWIQTLLLVIQIKV